MSLFNKCIMCLFVVVGLGQSAFANGVGVSLGIGFPFVQQAEVNFKPFNKISFTANYGLLDLDVGDAALELSMTALLVNFHPLSGSFYIGAGLGTESLDADAVDAGTGLPVSTSLDADLTLVRIGWMWGSANGGFWFGIDYTHLMPSGAEITIDAPGVPVSSDEYQDVVDAAETYGDLAYGNITFARFGWLF